MPGNQTDRRISAAVALAGKLREEKRDFEARTIVDLVQSSSGQRTLAKRQHGDLMRFRELLKEAMDSDGIAPDLRFRIEQALK